MTEEPSVLDYVKSKLAFWKKNNLQFPTIDEKEPSVIQSIEALIEEEQGQPFEETVIEPQEIKPRQPVRFIWLALAALVISIIAQLTLEPGTQERRWTMGAVLYGLSMIFLIIANLRDEWPIAPGNPESDTTFPLGIRLDGLVLLVPLVMASYIMLGGGYFTDVNVVLWLLAVAACVHTFWQRTPSARSRLADFLKFISKPGWSITVSRTVVVVVLLAGLILFFRYFRINQVPSEMISDHAEKLLDVYDVLQGKTAIFFPRNTGREAITFYLFAAIISIFHTGLTFLTMKLGMITCGVLTLPYIYLLGKEVANRRVGLIAVAFAGVAYWPNVISRFGLRFALYPLFVAPALFYLIRGIRTQKRNDFILSGLALGIGLHGYTPIRILPVVIVAAIAIYLIHRQSRGMRKQALYGLLIITVVSFVVFLPLFRYALENPEMFDYRTLTRLGTVERPLPGPAATIFLQNLWNAETMFFWSDGGVWVHSIPLRPALDVISAALFLIGSVLILIRYVRRRHWLDLFLLLSVPMLMLPSILSLAFPDENPSLNRTGGAYVIVFVTIAIALDGFLSGIETRSPGWRGKGLALVLGLVLFGVSTFNNYDLVFNQYADEFNKGAWNTTEMGMVVKSFGDIYGTTDSAYVVAYAYWVDTRLVAMVAGDTTRDMAIWPDAFAATKTDLRTKMFLINPQDTADLDTLKSMYPQASLKLDKSPYEGKDFWVMIVPAQGGVAQ